MAQTKSQTPPKDEIEYVLALDVSSKTGWAYLEHEITKGVDTSPAGIYLKSHGALDKISVNLKNSRTIYEAAKQTAEEVFALYQDKSAKHLKTNPNDSLVVVIEQTNLGRSRPAQKYLEFTHCLLTAKFAQVKENINYIDTSAWRQKIGLRLSAEDRSHNKAVSSKNRSKRRGRGKTQKVKPDSTPSVPLEPPTVESPRGKVTNKHLSVRFCNQLFHTDFKLKDNDRADAICMGVAYFLGAKTEEFYPLGLGS